jgi:hypothetical protein
VSVTLASRYDATVHRLALGIEPIDAARRLRVAHALEISLESVIGRPAVPRHATGLHALLYADDTSTPLDVRIDDPTRRFVPRRLRVPIATRAQVLAAEGAGTPVAAANRERRPFLYPGAAYDLAGTATALRGSVVRGGKPMRWARVEARVGGRLIGRAHGDDRGEFLLVLGVDTTNLGDVVSPVDVTVTVVGPAPAPAPPVPPSLDPLWDLPLEALPAAGAPDPVSVGEQPPAAYDPGSSVSRTVALPPGRLTSAQPPFVIP